MLPRFADVAVNAPGAGRQAYTYSVPPHMEVQPGQLVWIPFGHHLTQGIVFALVDRPASDTTRDIEGVVDTFPFLLPHHLELARWLSDYYLCPLFEAAALMLPPGRVCKAVTYLRALVDTIPDGVYLTSHQKSVLEYLLTRRSAPFSDLKKLLRRGSASVVVEQLVLKGLVTKYLEREPPRVRPRVVRMARLAVSLQEAEERLIALGRYSKAVMLLEAVVASALRGCTAIDVSMYGRSIALKRLIELGAVAIENEDGSTVRLVQSLAEARETMFKLRRVTVPLKVLRLLAEGPQPLSELRRRTGCAGNILSKLADAGIIEIYEIEVRRDPLKERVYAPSTPPILTPLQARIWEQILAALRREPSETPPIFLLHGITGSGKTEIYLRALAEVVRNGKQGIVMVPEIALTPQTIERFYSRFPGRVAILHSQLSLGERFDEWWRIRRGEADVVVGPRSAVFAPIDKLGLVVVDEEHEWTYKQQEVAPYYHARDVAIKLARLTGAVAILGSATPDVDTYYRAQVGEYRLLELPERVAVGTAEASVDGKDSERKEDRSPLISIRPELPPVEVVDLREELRAGNRSIFSRTLRSAMTAALAAHEQIILFLNRRGAASMLACRDCGFVVRCKRCDMPLSYHSAENDLVCHLCNYRTLVPDICPNCWSKRIRFLGLGTQKLEEEVAKLFPEARLLRWDRDTARGWDAHEAILEKFIKHEADILIGTQMIAKGLDLPKVTLVGVIIADVGLHLPDYRAGERTFQILTQVAGRAGRGALGGRVIIQTYSPSHYAILAASRHDYVGFYCQEIRFRQEHEQPPFTRLIRLTYMSGSASSCQQEAQRLAAVLRARAEGTGAQVIDVLGPAPAFVRKLRGRWRWQIILRGADPTDILRDIRLPKGWTVDVDPVSLL